MLHRLCIATLILGALSPRPAAASPVGKALEQLVRQNYPKLHRCYRKVLAVDRNKAGTVFIEVGLDHLGRLTSLEAVRDELKDPAFVTCLKTAIGRWSFAAVGKAGAANAKVVLPLTFRATPRQFVVHHEDTTAKPAAWLKGSRATERILLDGKNVGLTGLQLSLVQLNKDDRGRCSSKQAQLLLRLGRGALRIVLPSQRRGRVLKSGDAIYLPAGARHVFVAGYGRNVELLRMAFPPKGLAPSKEHYWRKGKKIVLFATRGKHLEVENRRIVRPLQLSAKPTARAIFLQSGELALQTPGGTERVLKPGDAFVLAPRSSSTLRPRGQVSLWIVTTP
jgi:hypothetical protein